MSRSAKEGTSTVEGTIAVMCAKNQTIEKTMDDFACDFSFLPSILGWVTAD